MSFITDKYILFYLDRQNGKKITRRKGGNILPEFNKGSAPSLYPLFDNFGRFKHIVNSLNERYKAPHINRAVVENNGQCHFSAYVNIVVFVNHRCFLRRRKRDSYNLRRNNVKQRAVAVPISPKRTEI